MALYRDLQTQEEIDRAYDPVVTAKDAAGASRGWMERSAVTRSRANARLGLRYGPTREEYLDLFLAGPGAPLHLFIHGGYWRRFSAADYAAVAEPLNAAGIAVAVVNYALCPKVTIDEITREVRAATVWCFSHASELGCDPTRLTISGHSAGGHLAAMAMVTDWEGEYGLPADLLKAGLPVSGLFDLAPFPWSYLQPKLQLTAAEVGRNSPMLRLRPGLPRQFVVVGGAESAEFQRQSQDYVEACRALGNDAALRILADADHFTILDALYREGGALLAELAALCHLRR